MQKIYQEKNALIIGGILLCLLIVLGVGIFMLPQQGGNKNNKVNSESVSDSDNNMSGEDFMSSDNKLKYKSITMEEAKKIFETQENYIILDVRRPDEFSQGHIPGAINVANEEIMSECPAELPDKNQKIYVYCRSGRRSREASEKLAGMGYTNIIEFGGIIDWTG